MAEDGQERLAADAHEIATRHRLAGLKAKPRALPIWARLQDTRPWLEQARSAASVAPPQGSAAAEWLLDNDYHVQRAILQIEEDLPPRFYHRLPGLAGAEAHGQPRVHSLAHALLRASHLQVSLAGLIQFVDRYQDQALLSIAELWAFPAMLRIACLELLMVSFSRLFPDVTPPFDVHPECGVTAASDDSECVARSIANLAVISTIQWKDFFDRTSRVEAILRRDPAGVYPRMDFETRDRYRHVIEKLAVLAHIPEWDVAERALAQCHSDHNIPSGHVGYWLVDAGRPIFEDAISVRALALEAVGRRLMRHPGKLYACALLLAGLAAFIIPALYLASVQASLFSWVLGIALTILPASVLSVTFVNWLVTQITPPRVLPKLDFENGIPVDCPTAVVMPVLVARTSDIPPLLQRLENHHLSNPDPTLRFVLLSDPADAENAVVASDSAIERALSEGIDRLNERYGADRGNPFYLMHRPRLYNPAQACWMAWERKRGKLEQFNRFILHGDLAPFSLTVGEINVLRHVRFVVTADADTRLPPGVVNRMVAALAHPLNSARFDTASGRVARGYTILQPRVEIVPDVTSRSPFSRIYGGDTTIDIYSRAVSDVYQDLLGTGVFIGKGIYEVASFEQSLEDRIPENRLLSHDLFEGLHGRVALATDIIVYEGFPSGYLDFVWRWHRWVRGDWQIVAWLFPFVPGRGGKWLRNRLEWFDRLKIFDNLRRSLVPVSTVALLLGGWFVLPGSPWVWTLLAIAALGGHLFTELVTGLAQGRRRGVVQSLLRRLRDHATRWMLAIIFLVSDSAIAVHAITVTLGRLGSGRHLLEWTSAVHMAARLANRPLRMAAWRDMAASPAIALATAAGLALHAPMALVFTAPLLLLWLLAPEIAVRISRPLSPLSEEIDTADRKFLRVLARRSWLFFESFVRPEDNWLPPDNYQEPPDEETAHRTSPTNIGMMMLSVITAWKLGHIGLNEAEMRLRNALDTIDRLERYRGHILNWYETRTLKALEPRYVSTVDSGNLAVSLVVVQQAFREAAREPASGAAAWPGLLDVVELLDDAIRKAGLSSSPDYDGLIAAIRGSAAATGQNEMLQAERLDALCDVDAPALRSLLFDRIPDIGEADPDALGDVQIWLERFDHHLLSMRRDLQMFSPWQSLVSRPPSDWAEFAEWIAAELNTATTAVAQNDVLEDICAKIDAASEPLPPSETKAWMENVRPAIASGMAARKGLHDRLEGIANRAGTLARGMDFTLLFDTHSRLFHIGYNVSTDRIDPHHYDLLASEARLASFFAISKGDVAPGHWFYLGRPVTKKASGLALVSWNGSMFEYLMPNLFLRSDPETLLGQSDRTAIDVQSAFARIHDMPWGISESSYASMGKERIYRYHAFGVPDLGLRRGLGRDLVVAPYATALALAVRPGLAVQNLRKLAALGLVGRYGFYEAADFTPERIPNGKDFATVRSYMAHHHGMSLAAIGNALCDDMFVEWFHADPHIRTIDLLLNERVPWELPPEISRIESRESALMPSSPVPRLHGWSPHPAGEARAWHAIGNGRFTTRFATDGRGSLHWQNFALTRTETTDASAGYRIYIRDSETGRVWPIAADRLRASVEDAQVLFHAHKAEIHRRENGIGATMTIGVAHGDDLEIRRVTLVNESARQRTLDLTSYAEVVLAPLSDAARHPAFSKLFVGSEQLAGLNGLIFTRRPRDPAVRPPVLLHRFIADDHDIVPLGVEADRNVFLGRHGDAGFPAAMRGRQLSGSLGWTLDPVFALRGELTLPAYGRREIAFITIAAGSRASALEIAERYTTLSALDWAMSDAEGATAREIHALGLPPDDVPVVQQMLSRLLENRTLSSDLTFEGGPWRGDLWALGLSGDHPVVLLRAGDGQHSQVLRFLFAAKMLWRNRGLTVDLVISHEGTAGYLEPVRERLLEVLREIGAHDQLGLNGGVHLIGIGHADAERTLLIERAAQIVLDEGSIHPRDQFRHDAPRIHGPRFSPVGAPATPAPGPDLARPAGLLFDNGFGGFAPDTGEYVIHSEAGQKTPAPWANVLANEDFGTIVTEAGLGFSWAINSGENRLTPWNNDPVRDSPAECLYLRDEENARLWTPTPQPIGGDTAWRARHGAGYTIWERSSEELEQELLTFVPVDDPVKIVRLRLHNVSPRPRRITATYFAEWLLGAVNGEPAPLRTADYDPSIHALLANNPWTEDFRERTAFLTSTLPPHSLTTSRSDFLGSADDPRQPEALLNWDLGGRQQSAGADCCAALQVHLDIGAHATAEVVFVLGQGDNRAHAHALVRRWQDATEVENARRKCRADWEHRLGAVTVRTPDPAFDLMINRWLPYQAASARIRARAGFYQAGGAFGFRDQLQDVLAFLHADPGLVRRHILTAAAHQFEEGDVLHWWHPPSDRGVRTHCSDDMLWLPYAVAAYVEATADDTILLEEVTFLRGPALDAREADHYARFDTTDYKRPLFEHCERAVDRAYRLGAHGLPLMGTGDWNDGMNRVGVRGRGESVWMGWFLTATITGFTRLCERVGRLDLADPWKRRAAALVEAVERAGWDGDWYLRAFDDDGRPWGSASDDECRIDSIAQSWAVLSGAARPERAAQAIASACKHLVRETDALIRLLDPPFDSTPRDPGYIKAYPPGIRENGGQYTHAAAWLGMAFARLGDGDGAKALFDRINPINRAAKREDALRYRIEPYVVAGDVAGEPPQSGRGGWSWYTGAAGWTWRLGVEEILGISLVEGRVRIAPCLPMSWSGFEVTLKRPTGALRIVVDNADGAGTGTVRTEITLGGVAWNEESIPFPEDGSVREVRVQLARQGAATKSAIR
jgi:cyclic beta-1,2-glucan synthetase